MLCAHILLIELKEKQNIKLFAEYKNTEKKNIFYSLVSLGDVHMRSNFHIDIFHTLL